MPLSAASVSASVGLRAVAPRFVAPVNPKSFSAKRTVSQRRIQQRGASEWVESSTDTEDRSANGPATDALERARQALSAETPDKDDLEQAVFELEAELQTLREGAAAAEAKSVSLQSSVATTKDQLLRLTADFENFRRRTATQNAQLTDTARGEVIKQLLPIIDGFEQARTQVKAESEGEQKINNSYQGLYKQMVDLMRSLGVEPVPTVGSPFDPEYHEAIMREPSSEHPDGTVLVEFRKGFKLGDKLLRAAMVQVSFQEDAPTGSVDE